MNPSLLNKMIWEEGVNMTGVIREGFQVGVSQVEPWKLTKRCACE